MAACGSDKEDTESGKEITGGIDDREFRLDRVDDAMCGTMKFY
jgi:hypothetical protein